MQPNKSLSPRNHLKDRITAAQSELTHKLAVIEPPSNLTPPRTIRHLLVLSLSPWCPNCQITFPLFSRLSIKIHFLVSPANVHVHDRISDRTAEIMTPHQIWSTAPRRPQSPEMKAFRSVTTRRHHFFKAIQGNYDQGVMRGYITELLLPQETTRRHGHPLVDS